MIIKKDKILTEAGKKIIEGYTKNRQSLKEDRFYPKYHFVSPGGHLNDPNGLCFYNGNWHLFYQFKTNGVFNWGHAYSQDSINWKDLPPAIIPGPFEKECWSGSVMIEDDRAIAVYYGLNCGIMIAVSKDPLLVKWEKLNQSKPVIPVPVNAEDKKRYSVFDPYIWKKDGKYYVVCGKYRIDPVTKKREREEFLFVSENLIEWTFMHNFLENDIFALHGDDGACPYFLPLEDKHILFHFSHMSGPKYIIGKYDKERDKFIASDGKSLTTSASFFGGLLAPSAYPENNNSIRLIHNISYCKKTEEVNQLMSLPRSVHFTDEVHDELAFNVSKDVECLRNGNPIAVLKNILLQSNDEYVLKDIEARTTEIIMEFEAKNIPAIEIRVMRSAKAEEYTSISIYRQRGNVYWKKFNYSNNSYRKCHESVLALNTLHSSLDCESTLRVPEMQSTYIEEGEKLKVRIFVDKSVIEVFVNDRISCVSRVYPTLNDSAGVSINPIGGSINLNSCICYDMKSIYE